MIYIFKKIILASLIKLIIKYPEIMKSKIFLKLMAVFPAKISSIYDKKVVESEFHYSLPLEQGLESINKKPKKILDICTGTGIAAFKAAEVFPLASIDAVDQAEEMINIAQRKAKDKGVYNIKFLKGNAVKLDYPNNKFDLIISSNAPIYLSEVFRILRPNGLLLVTYSFAGQIFLNLKDNIIEFFREYGFELVKLEYVGSGVYALFLKK